MKILFVGDIMLGRLVNEFVKDKPKEFIYGDTLQILQQADLRICNLECTISDRGEPTLASSKPFHFRTDAKNVEVLKTIPFDLVSLANNHILDYGEEALLDTLKILDLENISHVGAGKNIYEAEKPAKFQNKKIKIAIIGITDNEPAWEATEKKPGINFIPLNPSDGRAEHLIDHIHEIRENTDIIIISIHWGGNWGYQVPLEHIEFAHGLIDSGADIIYGHSPHVFRGIEVYHNRPILYSTGDFIDDYAVDEIERNDQTFIFMIDYEKKLNKIELYPAIIKNFKTLIAKGEDREEIILKMSDLCDDFDTPIRISPKKDHYEITI